VTDSNLALLQPPDRHFTLQITNTLALRWATGSVGMARSTSGTYITQCEPEGFRRLAYFLDRPDVRSNFTVRIEADESACPVLLSNGNLKGAGKLPGGRHYAVYEVSTVLTRCVRVLERRLPLQFMCSADQGCSQRHCFCMRASDLQAAA
jgi:aminopeptidase N